MHHHRALVIGIGWLLLACPPAGLPLRSRAPEVPRSALEQPARAKKLIEFGWDRPTPDFIRKNAARMDGLPFDGVVATLHVGTALFTHLPHPQEEFERDKADLSATRFSHLTHNFLLVWATPEKDWDWFSDADWRASEVNLRNFARTAKAGRYRGLFFDTEPYGSNPWYYPAQPHRQQKSFAAYEEQLRRRGAQFARALQEEMPDAVLFMTWGPVTALPRQGIVQDLTQRSRFLEREGYGLLASFIDGALGAIDSQIQLVDGNEKSYFFVRPAEFVDSAVAKDRSDPVDFEGRSREQFRSHYSFSNAVYVDWIMNADADASNFGHYLTAENDRLALLQQHTFAALETAGRYAWVYAQQASWWTEEPPSKMLAAIERAKTAPPNAAQDPSWNRAIAEATSRYAGRVRIAGFVTRNGTGLAGVSVRSGTQECAVTNADGYYECVFPPDWAGTIGPLTNDLRFSPPSRSYARPVGSEHSQNFVVVD